MRTSPEQRRQAEQRIRAAADALLRGDIPPGGSCDITTLARRAGVSRASLYRSYPQLKEEFEQRAAAARNAGQAPDPREARVARLQDRISDLAGKIDARDAELRQLQQFKTTAIARLAAQHDEITRLRDQVARAGTVTSLAARRASHTTPPASQPPASKETP